MTTNFPGSILYGNTNVPIFGTGGKPLFSDAAKQQGMGLQAFIVVDWGAADVDICGYWLGYAGQDGSGKIGYGWNSRTEEAGNGVKFLQYWSSNDNTEGGPEKAVVGVNAAEFPQGAPWRVHLNWFRGGPGYATVTVYPPIGDPQTLTDVSVGTRNDQKADTQDPGAEVIFNANGTIRLLRAI